MSVTFRRPHREGANANANAKAKGYRKERLYDYLYDSIYTLSGEADHTRASLKADTTMRKLPQFHSMFSCLHRYLSYVLRWDVRDPVPSFVERRWRGKIEQRREALRQLAGLGPAKQRLSHSSVMGSECWRHYARALGQFSPITPGDVLYVAPKANSCEERTASPCQRTLAVQTDYRESEAQTDPYSPEYTVRPGSAPELLTLTVLTWGRGLPVRLAQVEMIERMRAKRACEATLPPVSDLSQYDKRRRIMLEMERREWAFREQEIEELQEARLQVRTMMLEYRDLRQQEAAEQRLDKHFTQLQQEKNKRVRKIQNNYIASIRKLMRKCNIEGKFERRDIVKDYCNYDSQVYAPLTRNGLLPDHDSNMNVMKSELFNTYQGLLDLEASLPSSATKLCVRLPKPKRFDRYEMELIRTHEALKDRKMKPVVESKEPELLYKREKPMERTETPRVPSPVEGEEEIDLAIIYIQKLLRGRFVQNKMFEEKEKRLELIQELRYTHALQRDEQQLKEVQHQNTLHLQAARDTQIHSESLSEALLAGVTGPALGDLLDFLSKELLRVQDERRLHALTLLAKRQRRLREAKESGTRQREERRRREEDEMFKQVVQVHQDTVDLYLEEIILEATGQTADLQARQEVHQLAEEVNNMAYAMEESLTSRQSEEIVSELVYSFLVPEVQKITVRDRVQQMQKRHLRAAHQLIHNPNSTESDTSHQPSQD